MIEHNEENVVRLVEDIVEGWDLSDLIQYAVTQLTRHYMENEEEFHEEWSEFYDENA